MNKTKRIQYSKNFLLDFKDENKSCPIQLQQERWKLLKSTSSDTTSFEEDTTSLDTMFFNEVTNPSKVFLY
jgi:hypothetical protein